MFRLLVTADEVPLLTPGEIWLTDLVAQHAGLITVAIVGKI